MDAGASIDQDLDNDDYLDLTMIIFGCWFGSLIKRGSDIQIERNRMTSS